MALITPPPYALHIIRTLQNAGYQALLCGGCVRDALMGNTPKDYDIATSATPQQIQPLFPKTIPLGIAFGVIVVVDETTNQNYEVASFRTDSQYSDGRRPDSITLATPQEDALRRDFTINALFYDPLQNTILDYVDGQHDIHHKILRTVGNPQQRFQEDHLRLLRAVRFAARTNFTIEPQTWSALTQLAPLVKTVSPERIATELEAMLQNGYAHPAFSMLMDSSLLDIVLPEVAAMKNIPQPPDFHPEGDVWVHTLLLLHLYDQAATNTVAPVDRSGMTDLDPKRGMDLGVFTGKEYVDAVTECHAALDPGMKQTLAWSALLHDIGKPSTLTHEDRIRFNNHDLLGAEMSTHLLERLKRPRRVVEGAYDLIRRHIHFSTLRKMRRSKLRRWLRDPSFPMHLELHRLDCQASHGMLGNWWFGVHEWREEKAKGPEPEPLLRGSDILALGVPPGPAIGKILKSVEDARLESAVSTSIEAIALAKKILKETGQGMDEGAR